MTASYSGSDVLRKAVAFSPDRAGIVDDTRRIE